MFHDCKQVHEKLKIMAGIQLLLRAVVQMCYVKKVFFKISTNS